MILAGLSALLSHWRRHPVQLAMLLLGLALATALWSGVQAINSEARASYARAADTVASDRMTRIETRDGKPLSQDTYVDLRRQGWPVSPIVEGRLPSGPRLIGIEPLTLPAGAALTGTALGGVSDLTAFLGPKGLLITTPETAAHLPDGMPPVRLTSDMPQDMVITDIGIAQRLLGMDGRISHLILPAGVVPPTTLAEHLVMRTPAAPEDLARLTDSFHLNLTAFGLLSFVVGLFIVHSAIGLAFEQRRMMFRTLRALGVPLAMLTALLVTELLVLAVVGGSIGVVLGYGVAAALLPDVAATLRGLYGAEVAGSLSLHPGWWLAGIGMALAGTILAAGQSLVQLWRLPVLSGVQPRAWSRASARNAAILAGGGVVLLLLAGVLVRFGHGLLAGFAGLGGLLLGAALILPVVLGAITHLASRRARHVLVEWFWADTRQQLPGLSLALMALLLALATNVGVGTMVSSFRTTFVGWLDQRLASELYLTTRSEDEAARITEWLAPRVDAILPIWHAETRLMGAQAAVYGVADHATYRDAWPLLSATPDVWDKIAAGQGVLINEQLSRRAHIGLNDPLPIEGGTLPIVGIYSDYGNPHPQAIIAVSELTARFPLAERLRFGLRVAPKAAASLARDLRATFDLPEEAVVDQAGIKAFSLRVFDRTFTVTAALNVLTLGVAALALFASLMTLSGIRTAQLAPLWAMGLTRRHLAALDLARMFLLSLLTMAAALPLGLALAWVLLAVVNVEAFGWRLPMQIFPMDWLRLGLGAVVATLLAAALPVWRLARIVPAQLVKVFADER
jgi:putative ABC transport system permease protein